MTNILPGPRTVAIAGLGSRGYNTYAECAKLFPEKMKLVAGADIRRDRLEMAREHYHIPEEMCFDSAEVMLKEERLADVMIICTQDQQHVPQAIEALKKGYHIILEKPISPDLEQCAELVKVAEETGRKIIVCHVLRYTPFYNKLKELLDAGAVGDIVSIQHTENVKYWHQAHSFVRGNWRRSDETSPMILAKCCHDMDLLLWLSGKHCRAVSSYGGTYLFKPEKAPLGAAKRCLDGCQAKEHCPYDAEKIYITNPETGVAAGKTGWPADVVVNEPTEEAIREALKTGPYGRCVYACDNDVVDHQVVNLQMEDGASFQMVMSAFTSRGGRDTKIMGTRGEIVANLQENTICVMPFGGEQYTIDVSKIASDFSGHAGGDSRMVAEFLDIVSGRIEPTVRTTSLKDSVESHYVALAAERSRVEGGRSVWLSELI
ncbi:MAG: Gfo/Idh/MocA family oxidoreductase [Lachnospiraceae bacterium]|nr:Gfo/Idh/MocA family oxidoreductase [Lachnospiraceae bacterium]